MAIRNYHQSILEAVETLSNIADLEYDQEIGVVQKHELTLLREPFAYKTVSWVHQHDSEATISSLRETFRVIAYYLEAFYKGEYGFVTDQNTLEGIKAIMVLIAEAAKKLDNYAEVFFLHEESRGSVKEFKEYKKLQEVYLSKIARKKDEGGLSKWILSLSLKKGGEIDENLLKNISFAEFSLNLIGSKRTFVNLDTVKIDSEYELLHIRKQDSSRFFNPRLLRNVKLICDLENYFNNHKKPDPLGSIEYWYDHITHSSSTQIMRGLGGQLDLFLKELRTIKNNELIDALNKTMMALMFCSQNRNLLHHQPIKSCTGYFQDFLIFLRSALETPMYKRWTLHPPKKNNHLAWDLIHLTQSICRLLYTNALGWEEMPELIANLLKEAKRLTFKENPDQPPCNQIWEKLSAHYLSFTHLMKRHVNGPLLKLVKSLETSQLNIFDPLHQQNIPQQLFDLQYQDHRISLIRMPNPTTQHMIHQAFVTEEFKAFIKSYNRFTPSKKHLIINLQNRTSWMEFARCKVLEELQFQSDYINKLCVVTIAIHTDFYFQSPPYHQIDQSIQFIDQFKEHLKDDRSGFYFPSEISLDLFEKFTSAAFKAIHHLFFSNQKTLSREQRLSFIEIFFLFLEIKLLEWTQSETFSLMCKDGIDQGSTHVGLLFVFLKLINQQDWSENDWKFLDLILFMPALLLRERVILAEPFNRMILVLKQIEATIEEVGVKAFFQSIHKEFDVLFDSTLLKSIVLIPRLKTHFASNMEKGI